MTIRKAALRWLSLTHRVRDGDIFTSRYYPAAESWTGRDAWWVQIPMHRVEAPGERFIHVVCESPQAAGAFHYLRVPAHFLRTHLDVLDRPGDGSVISLFLSAEPDTRFRDERGAGLGFGEFLVPNGST